MTFRGLQERAGEEATWFNGRDGGTAWSGAEEEPELRLTLLEMSSEDRRRRWRSLGLGSVAEAVGITCVLVLGTVLSNIVREAPVERVWATRIDLPSPAELNPVPVKRIAPPDVPKVQAVKPEPQIETLKPTPEVQTKPVLPPTVATVHPVPRAPDLKRPVPEAELPKTVVPKFEPKVQVGAFAGGSSAVATVKMLPQKAQTGAFAGGSSAPATLKLPPQKVQTGGFGSTEGLTGTAQNGNPGNVPKLGSFDLPAGPGNGNGSGGAQGARGTVASAGFGNGMAGAGQGDGRSGGAGSTVHQGGFSDAQTALTHAAPEAKPREVASSYKPVEIVVKPNPVYTEEARRLHIQGEVLLQVVFGASGQLRILGITRGLGHGLDEAAVRAAQQIQFKPAQRNGQPVDTAATLHILFQLAS